MGLKVELDKNRVRELKAAFSRRKRYRRGQGKSLFSKFMSAVVVKVPSFGKWEKPPSKREEEEYAALGTEKNFLGRPVLTGTLLKEEPFTRLGSETKEEATSLLEEGRRAYPVERSFATRVLSFFSPHNVFHRKEPKSKRGLFLFTPEEGAIAERTPLGSTIFLPVEEKPSSGGHVLRIASKKEGYKLLSREPLVVRVPEEEAIEGLSRAIPFETRVTTLFPRSEYPEEEAKSIAEEINEKMGKKVIRL